MLSFEDALVEIKRRIRPLGSVVSLPILESVGCVLAEEVVADDFYPRFDNSAVDGYAVGEGSEMAMTLPLVGGVAAGEVAEFDVPAKSAMRIFTGAPVPSGAIAVVMQEDVIVCGGSIRCSEPISAGKNIRRRGWELSPGDRLLSEGSVVNAGTVGVLALVGKSEVRVRQGPRIAIVSTGDELVDLERIPVGAQIRDTSGPMLATLLRHWTNREVVTHRVSDDPVTLRALLESLAAEFDLIVATGGVSVGGHDFMPAVLSEAGEIFFHGVSMRPGKPVLFGEIGTTPIFGLPGNPASSFVGCHTFVREAVHAIQGGQRSTLTWVEAKLGEAQEAYSRDDFLRVTLEWREDSLWADPIFEQGSFGLRSLAGCRGIARVPANKANAAGDVCRVLVITA